MTTPCKRGRLAAASNHPRLDPERLKPGSAGHGAFNPAAGGSSPPGSTSLRSRSGEGCRAGARRAKAGFAAASFGSASRDKTFSGPLASTVERGILNPGGRSSNLRWSSSLRSRSGEGCRAKARRAKAGYLSASFGLAGRHFFPPAQLAFCIPRLQRSRCSA
jgi:hypothetical protein